jgi:hypothetical protein
VSAFFDPDARRRDVSGNLCIALDRDCFAAGQVTRDGAAYGYACSADVAAHARLLTEGHIASNFDVAFDSTINFDGSFAANVAAHDGTLANYGCFRHRFLPSSRPYRRCP